MKDYSTLDGIVLTSCISSALCKGRYSKGIIGGLGAAIALKANPKITAYRIAQLTTLVRYPVNFKKRLIREANNYKLIQPICGTSPELWELTELGKSLCDDIMNEYNRRINEGEKLLPCAKK